MYIVSYGSVNGYHEQAFDTYTDARTFMHDFNDEFEGMTIECIDDGSDMYWDKETNDYVSR